MTADLLLFGGLALVAVASALSMLLSKNTVYSALFLVLNFVTIAVLYLLLQAPFIAMVQITVYAGAIMVLFLFVIMLLGADPLPPTDTIVWQRPVAVIMGLGLVGLLAYALFGASDGWHATGSQLAVDFGDPVSVGQVLFAHYMVPFQVTGLLLLAAMVGVVILVRDERGGTGDRP
jgi:NADH-quinone oxidoreductase subunit J